MCKSHAEGGQRCAAHTRAPYEAIMADAPLIAPSDLRARVERNPDAIISHLGTQSGNAQFSVDMYNLERAYELALKRAPRLQRRRLCRQQQETLAALSKAHAVHVEHKLVQFTAAAIAGTARLRKPGEQPPVEQMCTPDPGPAPQP
jgi:hypothetical protein